MARSAAERLIRLIIISLLLINTLKIKLLISKALRNRQPWDSEVFLVEESYLAEMRFDLCSVYGL